MQKKSSVPVGETLENVLIELLAQKRKEIALAQINQHGKGDAHFYSQYLENMGLPLSIPGTANMIEHLSRNFDLPLYLKRFFKKYTIDCILDTVNETIKTSEPLRRLIYDWIKDQEKDWKEAEYAALMQQRIGGIQQILENQIDSAKIPQALQTFSNLVATHREELLTAQNRRDSLNSIAKLEKVKETALLPLIQMLLKSEVFAKDCIDHLYQHLMTGSSLDPEDFFRKMKILEIRNLMPTLEKRQVEQMLADPASIKELVIDVTNRERKEEFREKLLAQNGIESILDNGLSPKLLECIIVSHRILHPQTEETYETRDLANTEQYIRTVCGETKGLSKEESKWLAAYINNGNIDTLEEEAQTLIKIRRFPNKRWRSSSAASVLLKLIFSHQFRKRPEVLTSATRVTGSPPLPQPLWKNRIFEHLDTLQGYVPSFFRNKHVSFVALWTLRFIFHIRYYSPIFDRVYSHATERTLFHALPLWINYTPLFVLRAVNRVDDVIGYAQSNKI